MSPRHCQRSEAILLGLLAFIALLACSTMAQGESLRGDYTFGHEVNVFCPENNSRCYWLGPNSSEEARERLKRIYREKEPELYHPVCVVLEGEIDRESPSDGFAADYDGLIDVSRVHGACEDLSLILPYDLNHRRWVPVAIKLAGDEQLSYRSGLREWFT